MKRASGVNPEQPVPMDERDLKRGYLLVLGLLAAALLTALVGWVGGLGPPYREYAYDLAEDVGLVASLLLLPFAVMSVAEAGREGVAFPLRLLGWLLCTAGLLLPAVLLGNTYMSLPGYDVYGCGSLFNRGYDPSTFPADEQAALAGCDPIRAERLRLVILAASVGAVGAAWLGVKALRPSPPTVP